MVFANLTNSKCPYCGKSVERGQRYCASCGKPQAAGGVKCGCGEENPANARFCGKCGRSLESSAAPEIQQHHWARRPEDFAARIEANDLPGLLRRGLIVEPGTNAMLIERGVNTGLVPPGVYQLENAGQKAWNWLTSGVPEQATVLLVDITPTDLEFNLGGRFTKDPLPVGITIRIQVEVSEPARFLVNMLRGGERLSKDALREYLYPEVVSVADQWLRSRMLETLAEDPSQAEVLELSLEQSLKATFAQAGLRFIQARTVELNLEPYDKVKGIRGLHAIWQMQERARLEGDRSKTDLETERRQYEEENKLLRKQEEVDAKQRYFDLQKQIDFQALAEETQKVEMEERRLELLANLRRATMSDKMDEVRSEAEFDRFLDQMDRDKLLSQRERAEMLRIWKEEAEDRDALRAHLLAKLEIERGFEQSSLQIKLQHGQNTQRQDNEIEIARKRADYEFELRRRTLDEEISLERKRQEIQQERERLEQERKKGQIELENYQRQQARREDQDDVQLAMENLRQMKQIRYEDEQRSRALARLDEEERLRIRRSDELERKKFDLQAELDRMEREDRRMQAERDHALKLQQMTNQHDLDRLDRIGQMGSDALISISGTEQARLLADLKKVDALKNMSDEQILAMAAEHSPEVAKAFQERARAASTSEISQVMKEMYERMLSREADHARETRQDADRRVEDVTNAWEKASAQTRDVTERSLDRMADVSRSTGPTVPPVVVIPPQGGPFITPAAGSAIPTPAPTSAGQESKTCPDCGRSVPADTRFCRFCGHAFKGVE